MYSEWWHCHGDRVRRAHARGPHIQPPQAVLLRGPAWTVRVASYSNSYYYC